MTVWLSPLVSDPPFSSFTGLEGILYLQLHQYKLVGNVNTVKCLGTRETSNSALLTSCHTTRASSLMLFTEEKLICPSWLNIEWLKVFYRVVHAVYPYNLVITNHQLENKVARIVLTLHKHLESLVGVLQVDSLGHELVCVCETASTEQGNGIWVGIAVAEDTNKVDFSESCSRHR